MELGPVRMHFRSSAELAQRFIVPAGIVKRRPQEIVNRNGEGVEVTGALELVHRLVEPSHRDQIVRIPNTNGERWRSSD